MINHNEASIMSSIESNKNAVQEDNKYLSVLMKMTTQNASTAFTSKGDITPKKNRRNKEEPRTKLTKFGLSINEFMKRIQKYVQLDEKKQKELQLDLDHINSELITWNEFVLWFQGQVEIRDQVHNAQMFQQGQTRIVQDKSFNLWQKTNVPIVQHIVPICLSNYELIFVGFENKKACFFNTQNMDCVHQLHFDQTYQVSTVNQPSQMRGRSRDKIGGDKKVSKIESNIASFFNKRNNTQNNSREDSSKQHIQNLFTIEQDQQSIFSVTQNNSPQDSKRELNDYSTGIFLKNQNNRVSFMEPPKVLKMGKSVQNFKLQQFGMNKTTDQPFFQSFKNQSQTAKVTSRGQSEDQIKSVLINKEGVYEKSKQYQFGKIKTLQIRIKSKNDNARKLQGEQNRPEIRIDDNNRYLDQDESNNQSLKQNISNKQMQTQQRPKISLSKYKNTIKKESTSKDKIQGMKYIDDRFEILGLTNIKDYISFDVDNLGQINENKSKSLEPIKDNRSLSNERKKNHNIPQDVFQSIRENKTNKNDWDRTIGMINDRINSYDNSLKSLYKNQMGDNDQMNNNSLQLQDYPRDLTNYKTLNQSIIKQPDLKKMKSKTIKIQYKRSEILQTQLSFKDDKIQKQTGINQTDIDTIQLSLQPDLSNIANDISYKSHIIKNKANDKKCGLDQYKNIKKDSQNEGEILNYSKMEAPLEIKKEKLTNKILNLKKKSDNLQCLFDQRLDEYQYTNQSNKPIEIQMTEKEKEKVETSIKIKKLNKFKYAPGGSTLREEYQPKIPTISTCQFYPPLNLLIISFVDCETKFIRIQGMNDRNLLDIQILPQSYKTPFIVTNMAFELHQATQEFIGILGGAGQMHILPINPENQKFLVPMQKIFLPLKSRNALYPDTFRDEKVELITSINFDKNLGIFVTFFGGIFKSFEPILFKQDWFCNCNSELISENKQAKQNKSGFENPKISIVCSDLSKKLSCFAVGGQQGELLVYDIMSQSLLARNYDVHKSELINICFFEEQCQMISCSRDRQISLWEANKFECLQTIRDLDVELTYFNKIGINLHRRVIMACTYGIKCFKLQTMEKLQLQYQQTQTLVEQNQQIFNDLMLNEAKANIHTIEGRIIYNQANDATRKIKNQINEFLSLKVTGELDSKVIQQIKQNKANRQNQMVDQKVSQFENERDKETNLGRYAKLDKNYGKVTLSEYSALIQIQTNFDVKNPYKNQKQFEIYTVDSDFMVRIWDCSYDQDKYVNNNQSRNHILSSNKNAQIKIKESESSGKCKQSVLLKACDRYDSLMNENDKFKNLYSRGFVKMGALQRKIQTATIGKLRDDSNQQLSYNQDDLQQRIIAVCDNSGILQINNLNSGNILMSLTNSKNKLQICSLHFVNKHKIYIVGTCIDGTIMFFLKPNLKNTKENVSKHDLEHTIIKKGIHAGEITSIISNDEFVVIGGSDNRISVWKIFGCQIINQIQFPHSSNHQLHQSNNKNGLSNSDNLLQKNKRSISHMGFINMPSSHKIKGLLSQILVAQNQGSFHVCDPRSSNILKLNVIDSHLDYPTFAISQASKLNMNGIFVTDNKGSKAETYIFECAKYFQNEQKNKKDFELSDSEELQNYSKSEDEDNTSSSHSSDCIIEKQGGKQWVESFCKIRQKQLQRKQLPKLTKFKIQQYKLQAKEKAQNQTSIHQVQSNQNYDYKFIKLAQWIPHNPSFDQIFKGFPHPVPKKREAHSIIDCHQDTVVDVQIIGSGICLFAISSGQVTFFNFETGEKIYRLNTFVKYNYPKQQMKEAIFKNINSQKTMKEHEYQEQ